MLEYLKTEEERITFKMATEATINWLKSSGLENVVVVVDKDTATILNKNKIKLGVKK